MVVWKAVKKVGVMDSMMVDESVALLVDAKEKPSVVVMDDPLVGKWAENLAYQTDAVLVDQSVDLLVVLLVVLMVVSKVAVKVLK